MSSQRLQRMRSKLSHLRFEAVRRAGKEYIIAECLSRSPLPIATDEDTDTVKRDGTGGNPEHTMTIPRLLDKQAEPNTT